MRYLASTLAGDPLERSLAIANACGALSTRAVGGVDAQPTMDEVLAFFGRRDGAQPEHARRAFPQSA